MKGLFCRVTYTLIVAGTLLWATTSPAFADNCSSPGDCFGTAGSFNLAALGALALLALSLLLDFSPVGNVKGVIEGVSGVDAITGEKLKWWERALGFAPLIGPLVRELSDAAKA